MHLALTFLVIGCPGALVVAAPVAIVAGLGNAAKRGILIKGGERLERIAKADAIAFDKTGTLTKGQPTVSTVIGFDLDEEWHGHSRSQRFVGHAKRNASHAHPQLTSNMHHSQIARQP